ncbi:hypothetical protein TH53_21795 [Pedobacter lusitanus]|uniref:Uncharacterized protein n=2 Tax=Pedobacter lusitanus TaxID=1503925 RepID=A0A0D0GD41_9SPHI|nr:hypothetical protein TH53_21795 [Pedobacter lusitanus]
MEIIKKIKPNTMKKLILLLLIPILFSCKKDEKENKASYDIIVNVIGTSSFSLYEPNSGLVNHIPNAGALTNNYSMTATYDKGAKINIVAALKTNQKLEIEVIIKNTKTSQVIFQDKQIGEVKTSFTAQ